LGNLVDWLYICGDYNTQADLVELLLRLTPSSLQSELVDDWFPGNATVQSLFFSSNVRSFLNIFNRSLPGKHMRVLSAEMISAQVGSQVLVQERIEQPRTSWADFNLGSATIGIDCDQFQIAIPADTVARATISSITGLLAVRFDLSTPLNLNEGEEATWVKLDFSLACTAVSTILHQLLGQRLEMETNLRSSRSAPIRLARSAPAQQFACVDDQHHQELTGDARVPARRKSSSSGVLMCRKVTLLESSAANQSQSGEVDARDSRDVAVQEESQRANTPPTREGSARVSRAKMMEERRRELERSISKAQSKSRDRSAGKAAEAQKKDGTSRSGQDAVKKRKRSKSSRSIGEVMCRKEPVGISSGVVASETAEELDNLETTGAGCSIGNQESALSMEAEVVTQSEQESPKGGSEEFDETESHGNLGLGPAEVEVAGYNLASHVKILEGAGTGEVEREAREELGLAIHRNGNSGEEEESSNQAEANREEQVVEEPLEHGEQQQQTGGELVQQPRDEAGVSPVQQNLAGGEDQVEESEVVEQKTIGEAVKSKEVAPPPDASHTLHEEDAQRAVYTNMVRPSKSKSPAPQASSSVVNSGGGVERGLLVGNEYSEAGGAEELDVGEQERNICLTEIPGKSFEQMIPDDLNPADCIEKIGGEAVEHNIITEANKEVVNTVGENEKDDAWDGCEGSINSSSDGEGYNGTVDSCRRGTSKVQKSKLTQLAQDWSDEEFEISGVGRLGGMGDTIKEVVVSRQRLEVGGAAPDLTVEVAVSREGSGKADVSGKQGVSGIENSAKKEVQVSKNSAKKGTEENESLKRKGAEKVVVKKKKARSWRIKPSEATEEQNVVTEADDRSEAGNKKIVKRQEIGNKRKRLLGSKTAMLQDSPLMLDAPTFDTTLPAFEEAHNTSKHQKSFQEPPRRVNASNREKIPGESLRGDDLFHESTLQDIMLPGLQVKDKSSVKQRALTSGKHTEPSIKPRGKTVYAAAKKSKDIQPRRKMHPVNVSQANVGTKRKATVQNGGRKRKAPRRTITHRDFPNYDHLKIIPRKPEDVARSFHDASNVSEVSKQKQFFKQSPIPEEYKKSYANKTSRLNLTGSFMKRSGVVSKRRSSVNISAIESIILPQASRSNHDEQANNWDCEEEELGGKATQARRPASRSKSSTPSARKVDVGTSTDQKVVTMSVEEFNQVLNFVASGILLASANTQGAAVQEEKTILLKELRQKMTSVNM